MVSSLCRPALLTLSSLFHINPERKLNPFLSFHQKKNTVSHLMLQQHLEGVISAPRALSLTADGPQRGEVACPEDTDLLNRGSASASYTTPPPSWQAASNTLGGPSSDSFRMSQQALGVGQALSLAPPETSLIRQGGEDIGEPWEVMRGLSSKAGGAGFQRVWGGNERKVQAGSQVRSFSCFPESESGPPRICGIQPWDWRESTA